MSRVLAIGDVHLPAEHPKYLKFVKDIQKTWRCNKVVFMGDIIDHNAITFHDVDPSADSPSAEYIKVHKLIQKWYKAFPKAKVCIGNHDERVHRRAKSVAIPSLYIKSYKEVWNTPGWEWDYEFEVDGVHYSHGVGASGINPAFNAMKKRVCNTVVGHCHSRAGVKFFAGPNIRLFAVDTGCGVDRDAIQMMYGKHLLEKPFLSCAVIIDGKYPYVEPMPISKGEKYRRKL